MARTSNRRFAIRRPRWLTLTPLEDRSVPAAITVTGTGDAVAVDGTVTLREAILSVNAGKNVNADVVADKSQYGYGTNDQIRFDPALFAAGSVTVTLGSELKVARSVTITGAEALIG